MKTSKCFLSTLIAAAAMTATAYAEGEIISLNFGTTAISSEASGTAGLATYIVGGEEVGVSASGWTNVTGQTGTSTDIKNYDGETISEASVTWAGPQSAWGPGGYDTSTVLGTLQSSYLDLGAGNVWTVTVDSSFLLCDVYVYLSGDGGSYSPVNINGTSYIGGENITGSDAWGDRSTATSGTITLGTNAIKVTSQSGLLSLSNVSMGDSAKRATLSGIQIVNTYTGSAQSVELSGTELSWTNSAVGSTTWTNSTAEAGVYVAFNLTSDTTVNVAETGIVTDAIMASGAGILTLSGQAITLIGPGVVRASGENASVVVNNNLNFSSFGSVSGNVTINGTATFSNGGNLGADVVLGESAKASVTGGTLFIAATPSSGTIEVSKDAMVSLTTSQSGSVDATNISGAGTFAVAFDTSYTGTINITNTEFTGDIYVSSGYFTVNNAKFNDMLRLGDGVRFQLTSASSVTFSKNLVLEGTTEVHQNGNATLVFDADSSVKGTGTYVRKGGGTLTFSGDVDLAGFNTGSNATTNFSGTTKLESLTVSQGTVNISGSATEIETLDIAGNGATTFSTDATVSTIQVSGNSATSGALTIDSGKTVSATSMNNGWGLATLTVNGVLDISGNMTYATGDNVNTITGEGTISTKTLTVGNVGKYQLTGGVTLKIGSGGIQTTNVWGYQLRIGDSTLSASEDWSVSDSDTSGHIKLNSTENGGAKFDTNGHTITFGAALQDLSESEIGALTKKGEGTLTLSGANTYTGGTTISAGTLVAANASALGTGAVEISGGQLSVSDGITLSNALTVDVIDAYSLDSGVAAITGAGTLSASSVTLSIEGDILQVVCREVQKQYRIYDGESLFSDATTWNLVVNAEGGENLLASFVAAGGTWGVDSSGVLTLAIPEPSLFGLLAGLGALTLVGTRRRRR